MSMSKSKNFVLEVQEWNKVYDALYKSNDRDLKEWALGRISVWRARFPRIPTGMDVTERLFRALLKAEDLKLSRVGGFVNATSAQIADAHSCLGFAVIRFVNLITDLNQKNAHHRPIHETAKDFMIPAWIVELRHDAAHSGVPSIYRLTDAARCCIQWLEERYWAEEKPSLNQKVDVWKDRENLIDDDGVEEVNPCEELLEKYVKEVDAKSQGEEGFEDLLDALTYVVSQNTDEFVDTLLRPGFFLPSEKSEKEISFEMWLPLLNAMHNASLYSLPLLLEKLLKMKTSSQRGPKSEKAVAQWFLFITRQVARTQLSNPAEGKIPPEEPVELGLPSDSNLCVSCVDHDVPVNWDWLLQLAVRFPHQYTKYYLPVLCFLTNSSDEKLSNLQKMLTSFLDSTEVAKETVEETEKMEGDEEMEDEGDDCGWTLCSDKLAWKDTPLGTVPGKNLCAMNLDLDWKVQCSPEPEPESKV